MLPADVRAGARLISKIEAGEASFDTITGNASVVGITGPPGAGKSTLVDKVITAYRMRGLTVAVLAVDPSSPFTGGAVLGDRIRMRSHAGDRGVFIRSMAARGQLGGLAVATPAAIRVLDALAFDRIIVETVGVGQSEIAVAASADCTVLVSTPNAGDSVQAMKAGVIEVGDVFVVNKSDLPGAQVTARSLRNALGVTARRAPVVLTRADRGDGVPELVGVVERFLDAC